MAKTPRDFAASEKLVQITPRRLAQKAIHVRQINLVIGEGIVQQRWQIQAEA